MAYAAADTIHAIARTGIPARKPQYGASGGTQKATSARHRGARSARPTESVTWAVTRVAKAKSKTARRRVSMLAFVIAIRACGAKDAATRWPDR